MDAIREYIYDISVYLIFDSFIGIILPDSKYKKYISLVSGFILILIMLMPIKNILSTNPSISFSSKNDFQNQLISEVYEKAYRQQIKKIGEDAGLKIEDIELKIESEQNLIQSLKIKLENEDTDEKKISKLKNTLCLFYNLNAENINFD